MKGKQNIWNKYKPIWIGGLVGGIFGFLVWLYSVIFTVRNLFFEPLIQLFEVICKECHMYLIFPLTTIVIYVLLGALVALIIRTIKRK